VTRADASHVGTFLQGRYRVDTLLAHGGMSAVYRGFDTRLDRPVAVKIMDPRYADDPAFVARFQQEARAAAALHHPNVVAVHDQGVDEPVDAAGQHLAFLIMELVDGGTLRDLLPTDHALDVHTALSVVEPVLAALAAAHRVGVAHRDIKPENILISRARAVEGIHGSEQVKVADFGLARAAAGTNNTGSDTILGTVAYLAPEQVASGAAGPAGDVYSTGIVLYEMLTGTPPYDGDTALSVAYRHVNDDVPAPGTVQPHLPPALDALVVRATRRDPNDRPADATRFLHEIRRLREELGIELVPLSLPERDDFPTERIVNVAGETSSRRTDTATMQDNERAGRHGTRALPGEPTSRSGADEPNATGVEPRRWRGKRLVALCVVVGLLLVGGGFTWWLSARWVTVPGVTGLSVTEARQTLTDAGLAAEFSREPHNSLPESTVIGTDPAGGTEALPGDHITVRVSDGKPTVPSIPRGTDPAAAEQTIRNAHLTPRRDPTSNRYSAEVPQGSVIAVRPEPGTEANVEDPVTLVLSKGPAPEPVPEVTGQSKREAFDALRDKGFEPFVAGREFTEEIAGGRVIRTDPPAESRSGIDGSMRVGVYLSTAVKVPSLRGSSLDDATATLRRAGLRVEVESALGGDEDDHSRVALVVEQAPEAGELVARGSTIELRTIP